MSNLAMEDDFDLQDVDNLFSNKELDTLLSSDNQLEQLLDSYQAVEQFGMNPTAAAVLKTTGLMVGTSFHAMAVESLSYDSPEGEETSVALESLLDKIKEKTLEWSGKILSFIKSTTSRIFDHIQSVYNYTMEKIKKVGESIQAHPYRSAVIAVGAIVAVIGIIRYCNSDLPGATKTVETMDKFTGKLKEMIEKIKLPFRKINVNPNLTMTDGPHVRATRIPVHLRLTYTPVEESFTTTATKWTSQQISSLQSMLTKSVDTLKSSWNSFTDVVVKTAKNPDYPFNVAADKYAKKKATAHAANIWNAYGNKTDLNTWDRVANSYNDSYRGWFGLRKRFLIDITTYLISLTLSIAIIAIRYMVEKPKPRKRTSRTVAV